MRPMDIYDNRRQWLTYWIQTLVNGDRSAFERLYGY